MVFAGLVGIDRDKVSIIKRFRVDDGCPAVGWCVREDFEQRADAGVIAIGRDAVGNAPRPFFGGREGFDNELVADLAVTEDGQFGSP